MNDLERDSFGMYAVSDSNGPGPRLMGADTLLGNDVFNRQEEDVGNIKEIMLDVRADHKRFTLDVVKERLEDAPGFDKDNWPDMSDPTWAKDVMTTMAPRHRHSQSRKRVAGSTVS